MLHAIIPYRTTGNHTLKCQLRTWYFEYRWFPYQVLVTVESMNIITGSHEKSHNFWNERLLPSIQDRFGELAVDHSEECNIRLLLQPSIVYIIQRLQVSLRIAGFFCCGGLISEFSLVACLLASHELKFHLHQQPMQICKYSPFSCRVAIDRR